jgi:hypothetical protein
LGRRRTGKEENREGGEPDRDSFSWIAAGTSAMDAQFLADGIADTIRARAGT